MLLCSTAIGTSVTCQVTFSTLAGGAEGSTLSKTVSWGVAAGMGIWTSGGVSGGHINPAMTIALAVHRGFPVRRIPSYIIAQILGAFVSTLCVYGVYRHMITLYDPELTTTSATGFITSPISQVMEPPMVAARITSFWNEALGSALLIICALAAGDAHNSPPPEGMGPMLLLWAVIGILSSFSFLTGASLNPARDFGPRVRFLPSVFKNPGATALEGYLWYGY